jgi:hypothetical protein
MAINDFKNIENINLNLDSTAQLVDSKDLTIFKTGVKNITDFGMSDNDVIEFRVYDISNNLLEQTDGIKVRYIQKNDLPKYLKSDIDRITQEKIFDIDVEKLIRESGYGNGEFKVSFNFLKNYVGTNNKNTPQIWIHEVSPSRTEIRIMPLLSNDTISNQTIINRYNAFADNTGEFVEIINIIKNTIDLIETNISDLIDNYFVSKNGQLWLDKIVSDYKFNNLKYTTFKQKIYSDFKKLVYTTIDSNLFNKYEFYEKTQIDTLLNNKLAEAIELNAKTIAQYDIPQILKDSTKTKNDSQILQSLLNTNYITKSKLTQNDKLGKVKPNAIINTTPIVSAELVPAVEYVTEPQPTPIIGGGGGNSYRTAIYSQNMNSAVQYEFNNFNYCIFFMCS